MPGAGDQGGAAGRLRAAGAIAGVVLAAGGSSRFGSQKLLMTLEGETMVERACRLYVEAGCSPVVVVVSDERVAHKLRKLPLQLVRNAEVERGVGRSIGLGITSLPGDTRAAAIGVADQPRLSAEALSSLLRAFVPGAIVVPRYGDVLGNPRIFDRRYFGELALLEGDVGGRLVSDRHQEAVVEVALNPSLGFDVDRPQDWPLQG
jgi:molybdenum cofactor cytidylyltransferase